MLLVVCTLVLAIAAFIAYRAFDEGLGPLFRADECTATVQGRTVALSSEQGENAALIAAESVRRGLPPRAATIALATAYQESKINNIDYGHLDSVGLFQQRPSQGWGPKRKLLDPAYATRKFYDGLVAIDGWQQLRVTEAAQRVQRSAYPEAYADHEADARVLASALTGESQGGRFSCEFNPGDDTESDELTAVGLTARADRVRGELHRVFGDVSLGGFQPGGVRDGHMEGSAHYSGRAIDILLRPINDANTTRGWAIAAYLVAHADRLDISTVIYDGRIWTASRSDQGFRDYSPPSSSDDAKTQRILEHRDHVHVDVRD